MEWRPFVQQVARQQLEAQFHLSNPFKLADAYSWQYTLTDVSAVNIRALVTHGAVADTHHIDRDLYTLEPTAPQSARRPRFGSAGDAVVTAADGTAMLLLALATLAATMRASPLHVLQRGIPEVDAATAGLFRVVFGGAVLAFFATHPVDASRLAATFDTAVLGTWHAALLEWLRAHPALVDLLTPWLLVTGAAFTAGLFTRLTYALFVAGALIWAYVAVSLSGTHPYSPLVLALVALLPSRWGDAWSIDNWRRSRRQNASTTEPMPSAAPSRTYGYTVWVPGLIVGLAFAAAAWAKLTVPPHWTDWVANGTVKYHFVSDSVNAPVDWGVRLAGAPRAAVVASLAAVVMEALVITAFFVRSDWYRLAMGAGALALLAGFWIFMGVFWPAWWILLLGFLPWRRLAAAHARQVHMLGAPERVRTLAGAQLAAIALLLAHQFVVSALAVERAPMFSWYPMYSGTYVNAAEWNAKRPPRPRVVLSTDRSIVDVPLCGRPEEFVADFRAALDGAAEAQHRVWRTLRGCGANLAGARSAMLQVDLQTFDWERLEYRRMPSERLGPLTVGQNAHP